jgi:methyl-accepting chemotaxis protein
VAHGVLANAESTQRNNQIITERIGELTARSQRIVEILEVIKDIANKSELLALNAALEGTKAGEAGRGFSLVATQMQRLAENVMGSVRDIKTLTAAIREATSASVLATEEGAKLAADTTRSARQIAEIVEAQQGGTEQVTEVMDEVAEIARQSANGSREAVGAVQSLSTLADQLDVLIEQFRSGGFRAKGKDEPERKAA